MSSLSFCSLLYILGFLLDESSRLENERFLGWCGKGQAHLFNICCLFCLVVLSFHFFCLLFSSFSSPTSSPCQPQLGNLLQVNRTLGRNVPLASQLILMPNGAVAAVQQEVPPAQSPGVHADADQVSGNHLLWRSPGAWRDDHRPGPTLCPFIDFFYSSYFVCFGFFFLSSYKSLKTYELIWAKEGIA